MDLALKFRKLISECTNFQAKWTNLTNLTQTYPKMSFSSEIQNKNVEIKITIIEIPASQFSDKTTTFVFLAQICRK